ncbi:hypothetical protein D3C77_547050 [compost metagenome]
MGNQLGDGFEARRTHANMQGHGFLDGPLFDKALHGPLGRHANEGIAQGVAQAGLLALCQRVLMGHQHHQAFIAKGQ